MTINTIRRKLDRNGFRLWKRGDDFRISDHSTGGLVHNDCGVFGGFSLTWDEVLEWTDYLCD